MINKINSTTPNFVSFKQNQTAQTPPQKTKFQNYKDNFIQSSKFMLPSNIALALVFSLFNARKDMSQFGKILAHHLATFTGMSLIISGVDSLFRMNSQSQK